MLHEEAEIVEIDRPQNARLGAALIGNKGRVHNVANTGETALQEIQRGLQDSRVLAISLDRVDGVEHPGEGVLDLVGHARGDLPEHRAFFLLGETGGEDLAFAESARHRVEPIKQLRELAGHPLAVTRRNRLDPALADLLHIARQYAEWVQQSLEPEVSAEREGQRQTSVHQDKYEEDFATGLQ